MCPGVSLGADAPPMSPAIDTTRVAAHADTTNAAAHVDSIHVAVRADSTTAHADTTAIVPPAALEARAARRMQDTVSVIHGVTVHGAPVEEKRSTTTTRLDRSAITRFMPATASDAMVSAPGVELVK